LEEEMKLTRSVQPSWFADAACSGEMGHLFYPPVKAERRSVRNQREARAKAVCAGCPVQMDCLELAIATDERYGIWGGMTDLERRRFAEKLAS
jgi:WhiB family redox-sensing transcriptional regulator